MPTENQDKETLLAAVNEYLEIKGGRQAGASLVHRLDRDTSGLLVLAKHQKIIDNINQTLANLNSLAEKAVGEILSARIQVSSYLPRWRPQQDYRQSYSASTEWGGAILDCIHEIDLGLWYFGPAGLVASAQLPARSLGLQTEGLVEMILRHESGVLSSIHLNYMQRDYRRGCQVIGTQGTLYWDFSERCVRLFGEDGNLHTTIPEPDGWETNQMYLEEMKHFLHALATRTPTSNPISGGLAALKIALEARRS